MTRRTLVHLLLIVSVISLIFGCPSLSVAETSKGWPVFKGAWFTIKYPPDFIVKPGQKSPSSVQGYDSAFFISPDHKVEFYIFSPQWQGTPDFDLDSANEVIISKNVTTKDNLTVTQVTVKEKNGQYLRSWLDREDKLSNTRSVFGIKYRDQVSYNKYRPAYLIFKQSLIQLAD